MMTPPMTVSKPQHHKAYKRVHSLLNSPSSTSTSYVAHCPSVDQREAFLNDAAEHDHIDYVQSFAPMREKGLPRKIPAAKLAIRQDPKLLNFQDRKSLLQLSRAKSSTILPKPMRQHGLIGTD